MTRYSRASLYFATCLAISAVAGVLQDLGDHDAPWPAIAGCLAIQLVAYGLIWPIGTFTLDRPRDWVSPVFGLVWGFCEGLLLLSGYRLVELLDANRTMTVLLAFVLLSAFQGVWHAAYWDKYVAPEHNDPAWNLRKVLLCHVPNLAATLTFYAAYQATLWFVVFQMVSLALCSWAMRFPRPGSEP